jgi:hypothetical protein
MRQINRHVESISSPTSMHQKETPGQWGLHKEKSWPSRKVSCDMWFLCTYIERKASEAGLDTSNLSLVNIQSMFEAAGKYVNHFESDHNCWEHRSNQEVGVCSYGYSTTDYWEYNVGIMDLKKRDHFKSNHNYWEQMVEITWVGVCRYNSCCRLLRMCWNNGSAAAWLYGFTRSECTAACTCHGKTTSRKTC